MEIFEEIEPLRAYLKRRRTSGQTVGLVPTMGALHAGHLSLLLSCVKENDTSVCSIFVNPTQFNSAEDLAHYPRTLKEDQAVLAEAGCDVLFCPATEEMYSGPSELSFDFGALDKVLEGKFRPGHFSGVALAVSKLFNIVGPDRAYFGQKDFQQFLVVTRMVEELKFNVRLKSVPILREADGLAMSSRNQRLSENQRAIAPVFYKALLMAKEQIDRGDSIEKVKLSIHQMLDRYSGITLEYFEAAHTQNLKLLDRVTDPDHTILLIAGYVGQIRLIDNLLLKHAD